MTIPTRSFRQGLMLFSACGLIASVVPVTAGRADTAPTTAPQVSLGVQLAQTELPTHTGQTELPRNANTPGQEIPPDVSRGASESIVVKAQRRLVKEKNSPSAVTELDARAIGTTGVSGSPQTLLRQAPSIYVYQQSIGDSAPELTVRGARGLETAQTLDDVPVQDLLSPGASSISEQHRRRLYARPD